jgi:hypothetical protein
VVRVVLFGSRAGGNSGWSRNTISPCSCGIDGFWDEVRRLVELSREILIDPRAVISAKPFRAGTYNDPRRCWLNATGAISEHGGPP